MRPVAWKSAPAIQTAEASWRVPRWRNAGSAATGPRNGVSLPAGTPKRSTTPDARSTRARAAPPLSVTTDGGAAGSISDACDMTGRTLRTGVRRRGRDGTAVADRPHDLASLWQAVLLPVHRAL